MKYVDYIIVGGGISGSVLSYVLMKHGASVHLFDLPAENKSSAVAAGLWNPIVLKRLKKVWMADEMMASLHEVYPDMENWTGTSFFDPRPIRRVFHNPGEQNNWMELTDHPGFSPYLNDQIQEVPEGIKSEHGSGLTKGTGRVRVREMMAAVREKLRTEGNYTEERFDWSKLMDFSEGKAYGDIRAHAVISCEGLQLALKEGPDALTGFAPVKGEVLKVKLDHDLGNECIHQGHFMLGEGNNEAFVGATYAWDGFDQGITPEKRKELEEHIEKVWKGAYEVTDHQWGIRPAVKDRRPMVGPHPVQKDVFVFNGLGSRGILMAPWLATRLAEQLLYGVPLPEEILPGRYA